MKNATESAAVIGCLKLLCWWNAQLNEQQKQMGPSQIKLHSLLFTKLLKLRSMCWGQRTTAVNWPRSRVISLQCGTWQRSSCIRTTVHQILMHRMWFQHWWDCNEMAAFIHHWTILLNLHPVCTICSRYEFTIRKRTVATTFFYVGYTSPVRNIVAAHSVCYHQ